MFICICACLSVCVSLCFMAHGVSKRVSDPCSWSYKQWCVIQQVFWENNLGPLEKHHKLLACEHLSDLFDRVFTLIPYYDRHCGLLVTDN